MNENKFNLKDDDEQEIDILDKNIIESFFKYNDKYWKNDIFRYNEYMKDVSINVIESVNLWIWNITDKEDCFECILYLKDGRRKDLIIDYDPTIKWLEENNLLE